jgi:hypothetical protein
VNSSLDADGIPLPPPSSLHQPPHSIRLPFHRKAQALAHDLQTRFGAAPDPAGTGSSGQAPPDPRFAWEDAAVVAGDSGALAAAAWHEMGVARLPEGLAKAVAEGGPLTGGWVGGCVTNAGGWMAAGSGLSA